MLLTWKEVLDELGRCDGQITDYGRPVGQLLFDPALANAHGGVRIEGDIFSILRDEGWIATDDQGEIKRYRITEAGTANLNQTEPHSNARARASGMF
jgi:hypothetical protein